jgi:hypothetical protein
MRPKHKHVEQIRSKNEGCTCPRVDGAATGNPVVLLEIPCQNEMLDKEASIADQPAE